jgi:hypothetical protein
MLLILIELQSNTFFSFPQDFILIPFSPLFTTLAMTLSFTGIPSKHNRSHTTGFSYQKQDKMAPFTSCLISEMMLSFGSKKQAFMAVLPIST